MTQPPDQELQPLAVDDVVGKAFVVVRPVGRWHRVRAAGSVCAGVPGPR